MLRRFVAEIVVGTSLLCVGMLTWAVRKVLRHDEGD